MLLVIFEFIITLVHDMCMKMLSCQSVFADFLQKMFLICIHHSSIRYWPIRPSSCSIHITLRQKLNQTFQEISVDWIFTHLFIVYSYTSISNLKKG